MEKGDLALIEKYSDTDKDLGVLYREHLTFGKEIDKLENKSYLSKEEQLKLHDLKKKKLVGRDKLESLLLKYRQKAQRS